MIWLNRWVLFFPIAQQNCVGLLSCHVSQLAWAYVCPYIRYVRVWYGVYIRINNASQVLVYAHEQSAKQKIFKIDSTFSRLYRSLLGPLKSSLGSLAISASSHICERIRGGMSHLVWSHRLFRLGGRKEEWCFYGAVVCVNMMIAFVGSSCYIFNLTPFCPAVVVTDAWHDRCPLSVWVLGLLAKCENVAALTLFVLNPNRFRFLW